jgi:hypothetical protein
MLQRVERKMEGNLPKELLISKTKRESERVSKRIFWFLCVEGRGLLSF